MVRNIILNFPYLRLHLFICPNSTHKCINSFVTVASSSFVQFFVFSSNYLNAEVCSHCSFARLEYSSIFLVSNTLKSIYFTSIPFIPVKVRGHQLSF